MYSISTFCPFCHSTFLVGAERCGSCGATIEYGRIPPRFFLFLLVVIWGLIGAVHVICDNFGVFNFIIQLSIAVSLCLMVWGIGIRKLSKKYRGRVRFVRNGA